MRAYEMVFIARPELEEDELTAMVEEIEGLVEHNSGKVTRVEPWGLRRLAYPVQDQEEGHYAVLQIELEPEGVAGVKRGLELMQPVMRHLIVRVD